MAAACVRAVASGVAVKLMATGNATERALLEGWVVLVKGVKYGVVTV